MAGYSTSLYDSIGKEKLSFQISWSGPVILLGADSAKRSDRFGGGLELSARIVEVSNYVEVSHIFYCCFAQDAGDTADGGDVRRNSTECNRTRDVTRRSTSEVAPAVQSTAQESVQT